MASLHRTTQFLVGAALAAVCAPRAARADRDLAALGYRSFYSGHTSSPVAALIASAWTLHFRDGPQAWPWVVTGVVGASVATERVLAGRHFPTDVLVGAAAGFAVGTAVPWLHVRRPSGRSVADLRLVPAGEGLALGGRW